METPLSNHKTDLPLSAPQMQTQEGQGTEMESFPKKLSSGLTTLDAYFDMARSQNISLLSDDDVVSLVRRASLHRQHEATANSLRVSGISKWWGFIKASPLLLMMLTSVVCIMLGYGVARIVDVAEHGERNASKESLLRSLIAGEEASVESNGESVLSSVQREHILRFGKNRLAKNTIPTAAEEAADKEGMKVFAGLPVRSLSSLYAGGGNSTLRAIQYMELSGKEVQRFGINIIGKETVEITCRFMQKDSIKSLHSQGISAQASAQAFRFRIAEAFHELDAAHLAITPADAILRSLPHGVRLYILTDTLGRTLPMLRSTAMLPFYASENRSSESSARQEIATEHSASDYQRRQAFFAAFDAISLNSKGQQSDTSLGLVGIRLQTVAGFHAAELRNVVFWFVVTPHFIELLPARLRSQTRNEVHVAELSHGLAHYMEYQQRERQRDHQKESARSNVDGSTSPFTSYYLAQTQTLVPQALSFGSMIVRAKPDKPFQVPLFLHESRSLRITLHTVTGAFVQECASMPSVLYGHHTATLTLRPVASGVYMMVARTERNEIALQYVYVD